MDSFARVKTKSARRRKFGSGVKCTRYRSPARWSRWRTAISGRVSRERIACMFRLRPGDELHDSVERELICGEHSHMWTADPPARSLMPGN